MKVIIMQGVPGSGKSTYAREIADSWNNTAWRTDPEVVVVSADDYREEDGEYVFRPSSSYPPGEDPHSRCFLFFASLVAEKEPLAPGMIIVDNTNTQTWEMAPYVVLAKAHGATVDFVRTECPPRVAHDRNVHGVALETIEKMHARMEKGPPHWGEWTHVQTGEPAEAEPDQSDESSRATSQPIGGGDAAYDSKPETYEHIQNVQRFMHLAITWLMEAALLHDRSKLEEPELSVFDTYTPKLRSSTYGGHQYKAMLEQMKPALDHHYVKNSHHPEHYDDGIRGMSLMDLLEMVCDWKAATLRHDDGDIMKSIELNQERFGYSDELKHILINTVHDLFLHWDDPVIAHLPQRRTKWDEEVNRGWSDG